MKNIIIISCSASVFGLYESYIKDITKDITVLNIVDLQGVVIDEINTINQSAFDNLKYTVNLCREDSDYISFLKDIKETPDLPINDGLLSGFIPRVHSEILPRSDLT